MEKGNRIPKQIPDNNQIKPNKTSLARSDSKWRFSFSYWRQHKHFGLNCENADGKWYISLLAKLKELSDKTIEEIFNSHSKAYRFHQINWNQKGIETTREEIDWIPKDYYLKEEYEFYQFNISLAFGRVVGFFDEDHIFHIVFLDPMHNMQPSSYTNYQVRATQKLLTPYEEKHQELLFLKSHIDKCSKEACDVKSMAQDVTSQYSGSYLFLEEMFFEDIETLTTKAKYTYIQEILIDAIDLLLTEKGLKNDNSNTN